MNNKGGIVMKIGFKPKSYNDIIYFDTKYVIGATKFINNLINSAILGGDEEVDLIIQPNKKEIKDQIKTTED